MAEWATSTVFPGGPPLASHCRSPSPKTIFDRQALRYGLWARLGDSPPGGLVERHRYVSDSAAGGPVLYGLSGIAVGDVDGQTGEEIVLTTLNGDLVVYALTVTATPDVQLGSLLHWSVHEGALGASNAIVIADLDPNLAGNEVYVAGSMGIRKFKLL